MSFVTVVKTDYGHLVQLYVEEYDEVDDVTSAADLSGFDDKILIIKRPDNTVVTVSGELITDGKDGGFQATVLQAWGIFNQTGYYEFGGLFQNNTQRFHTSTFGEDIDINLEG